MTHLRISLSEINATAAWQWATSQENRADVKGKHKSFCWPSWECPPEELWGAAVGHSQEPLQPFLFARSLDWCCAELGREALPKGTERRGAAQSRAVHSCAPDIPPLLFVFHPFCSHQGSIHWAGIIRELLFSWYSHHTWAVGRAEFLLFQSYKGLTETSIKKKVKVMFVHLPFALQAVVLRNRTPFPKLDGCSLKVGCFGPCCFCHHSIADAEGWWGAEIITVVWSCAHEGIAGAGFSWQFPMANPVRSRSFILPMWEKRSQQFAGASYRARKKKPGCCSSFTYWNKTYIIQSYLKLKRAKIYLSWK